MYEATLALLETLTAHVRESYETELAETPDHDIKHGCCDAINELDDYLDKARHELKGGA